MFAGSLLFPWNQLCAKFSILFCYRRLFGLIGHYGKWIYAIGVSQVIYHVPACVVMVLRCRPFEQSWSPVAGGHCVDLTSVQIVIEALNALIDFALVVLAASMLRHTPTTIGTKINIGLLFAIGGM